MARELIENTRFAAVRRGQNDGMLGRNRDRTVESPATNWAVYR